MMVVEVDWWGQMVGWARRSTFVPLEVCLPSLPCMGEQQSTHDDSSGDESSFPYII